MYDDAKLTYIVIAVLVVLLGGVAFFLQGDGLRAEKIDTTIAVADQNSSSSIKKNIPVKTSLQNTKTNTSSSTLPVINSTTTTSMITSTSATATIPKEVKGAIISTNFGDIEVVFDEKKTKTVTNFVSLASTNFYEGVRFHRVIKGFMIQGGDPLSKDIMQKPIWGQGGPGYKFADELVGNEKYVAGTLAMANSGPNTNGSQFFIMTVNQSLPPLYTVFGHVVNGMDTVLKIENVQTEGKGTIDRPVDDVVIKSVVLK